MVRARSIAATFLVASAATAQARAQVKEPVELPSQAAIPAGYHIETRVRTGLVFQGTATFTISYVLPLPLALSNKRDSDRWLVVPILGPFVTAATRDPCRAERGVDCSGGDAMERTLLVLDGVAQGVGATLAICGLAFPRHVLVPDEAPAASRTLSWTVEPRAVGRAGLGLGVTGTF